MSITRAALTSTQAVLAPFRTGSTALLRAIDCRHPRQETFRAAARTVTAPEQIPAPVLPSCCARAPQRRKPWLEETGGDRGATYHAAFRQLQEQDVDVHGEARYVDRLLARWGRSPRPGARPAGTGGGNGALGSASGATG